jgi:hypothetical protein
VFLQLKLTVLSFAQRLDMKLQDMSAEAIVEVADKWEIEPNLVWMCRRDRWMYRSYSGW